MTLDDASPRLGTTKENNSSLICNEPTHLDQLALHKPRCSFFRAMV